MPGATVGFILAADDDRCRAAAHALFPDFEPVVLPRRVLRPTVPFEGPLFTLVSRRPRGTVAGLVVPAVATGVRGGPREDDLVPITDHVNLESRGPLTGRWPAGVPRDFPDMTGVYQPGLVRPREGARVYSSGVVAAGVADARRLTRFEARAVREAGWPIVSDSLVPVAIVAAYYGLRLAAWGVAQAPTDHRE